MGYAPWRPFRQLPAAQARGGSRRRR